MRERERGEDVDRIDVGQHVERVVGEPRLGRRPEHARVVHEQVDAAELGGGRDEIGAVAGVGHVAGDGTDDSDRCELLGRGAERLGIAGVDDEIPAVGRK